MKSEPIAVTPTGLVVKATYEQGETLSELGLSPEQSAAFWAECEADWQAAYPWAERKWHVGRVTLRLDWLFEREIGLGSATNEYAKAWWSEVWFYRLGLTLWNPRAAREATP